MVSIEYMKAVEHAGMFVEPDVTTDGLNNTFKHDWRHMIE